MRNFTRVAFLFCMLSVLLAGVSTAGCKSKPRINWESRLGIYTFDQAVAELGPPDKTATLTDGRTICDWIERGKGGVSFGVGTGFSTGGVGVGVGQSVGSGPRDAVLRLTFDRENRLVDWARNR